MNYCQDSIPNLSSSLKSTTTYIKAEIDISDKRYVCGTTFLYHYIENNLRELFVLRVVRSIYSV